MTFLEMAERVPSLPNPLVIYHGGGCFDGFCCAWIFRTAFPNADLVAAQHGEPPPDVTGRVVYVADYSYPRPVLEAMHAAAKSLRVLDHHRTAEADLAGLPYCTFDMQKSGGRLVWEHLYGAVPASWIVAYTEDRDLWLWKLPESREINAALRSYPMEFAVWDALACRPAADLAAEGRAILRAETQTVAGHVKNAREVTLAGHRVLCVNATTLTSEIAGALAEGRPFGVCYFDRADGLRVYSLRSRDGGLDVSAVAKAFGGGGHRSAAGFQVAATADVSGGPG